MKPTLLLAMLSMVLAVPEMSAMTELETLRARCSEQERQIQRLEEQIQSLRSGDSSQKTTVERRTTTPDAPDKATSPAVYTIQPGDSIERIARKNGCSPAKLAKANGLKLSSVIHPGKKLRIPGTAVAQTPPPTPTASRTPAIPSAPVTSDKTHQIKAGETYASISRKYGVSIDSLIAANPEVKPTSLRPGSVIHLSASKQISAPVQALAPQSKPVAPLTPSSPAPLANRTPVSPSTPATQSAAAQSSMPASAPLASSTAPKTTPSPAPSPSQEQTPSPNPEKKIRSVTIEGEMTYGEFAAKNGTDTARLNDLNGLDLTNATVLAKGSELYVPAQP